MRSTRTRPSATLGALLVLITASALGVRCSSEGLPPSSGSGGAGGITGEGAYGGAPIGGLPLVGNCVLPAPSCARGERSPYGGDGIACGDAFYDARCVNDEWFCDGGNLTSLCSCFGSPPYSGCTCSPSGWSCTGPGTGGRQSGVGGQSSGVGGAIYFGTGGGVGTGGLRDGVGGRGTGGNVGTDAGVGTGGNMGEPGGRGIGGSGTGGMGTGGGVGIGGSPPPPPADCPVVGLCQPGQPLCYEDVDETSSINNPTVTYSCKDIPMSCTGGPLTCQCLCDKLCPHAVGICECGTLSTSSLIVKCTRLAVP